MNPEDKPLSSDQIEAHIGDDASNVIVGKDISQVGDISESDAVAIGRGAVATSVKNFFFGEKEDVIRQRNRHTMLNLVKSTWIEGVLEQSLHNAVLIDLNLEARKGAVDYPWDMIIRTPDQADRPFPQGTKIPDVFAKMNQSLLILGEPGSGKTTMLLELARDLIARAEIDHTLLIPVVFNLSSWAERRKSIDEWLVDEFNVKYSIPKKLAQAWVASDEILLLLDGLDEVKSEYREECVNAINVFRQNHLIPMAICSRTAEYEALTSQLKLQEAVILKPLTSQQIDEYLTAAGHRFQSVSDMLQQDTTLQELAQSPLLLSIMTLAYQNMPIEDIQTFNSIEARRKHLLNAYINKMFVPTARTLTALYPKDQIIRWLQWLARNMFQRQQTIFLIEQMQPNWAQSKNHSLFLVYAAMLMWGPIYGLSVGLSVGLIYGLSGRLIFWLIGGLSVGLIYGLFVGLFEGLGGSFREIKLSEQFGVSWRKIRSSSYTALYWGLFFWLTFWLTFGLSDGMIFGLIFGLIGGTMSGLREIQLVKLSKSSWGKIISNLFSGLVFGLYIGLVGGLIGGLSGRLLDGLDAKLSVGGLIFGPIGGLIFGLIFEPSVTVDVPTTLATQTPNQGIKLSTKYALTTGLSGGLSGWLMFGLMFGLDAGLVFGLSVGLIGGLIGGGDVVTKHCILRLILWWKSYIPWNYASFLDYCHDRIFLRKVGGGYIFIHRMMMEHFAQLDEADIKRLASE